MDDTTVKLTSLKIPYMRAQIPEKKNSNRPIAERQLHGPGGIEEQFVFSVAFKWADTLPG